MSTCAQIGFYHYRCILHEEHAHDVPSRLITSANAEAILGGEICIDGAELDLQAGIIFQLIMFQDKQPTQSALDPFRARVTHSTPNDSANTSAAAEISSALGLKMSYKMPSRSDHTALGNERRQWSSAYQAETTSNDSFWGTNVCRQGPELPQYPEI